MKLNDNDYQKIAAQIEKGHNIIDYEKGDEMLHIECTFETEGSFEDDYYNGTGAYVEFARNLYVESAEIINEDGKSTPANIDTVKLEGLVA